MNNQEKIAVDPQIKKEINEEGFDEGAAVIVGKKEEMPQMLERLEKEGMAENLGAYIKMHKEIALPNTEMTEEIKEKVLEQKGLIWRETFFDDWILPYQYIDKDGNIAAVILDSKKINDFQKRGGVFESFIKEELIKLGFNIDYSDNDLLIREVGQAVINYRDKIKNDLKDKKKEEFDF